MKLKSVFVAVVTALSALGWHAGFFRTSAIPIVQGAGIDSSTPYLTITAHRMTAVEKIAYDQTQTLKIADARLSH